MTAAISKLQKLGKRPIQSRLPKFGLRGRTCRQVLRLSTAGIFCGWALQGYLVVGHWDTWWLGPAKTERILCDGTLLGYSAVGHCRDTWWLGTVGILCGWALQGCSAVGHCRDTWALQGHWLVGHCRDAWWYTLRLGTAGTLGGWALQGCVVVGHCRKSSAVGPCSQAAGGGRDRHRL